MPLDYHFTVDAPATFGADSDEVTQTKLNENFDVSETNEQGVEDRLEDTVFDIHGSGVLWGMAPTIPVYGGLSVDVASGRFLIGYSAAYAGGNVTCGASKSPGYIWLQQDGTWHVDDDNTAPTDKSAFLYATYTSDGYDVLTVTLEHRGVEYQFIRAGVAGAVASGIIATGICDRNAWLDDVQIVLGDSGTYANTTVDFSIGNAGGALTTVFTTQSRRPTLASLIAINSTAVSGVPEANRVITAGQVWQIEVDGVATGAKNLGVLVRYRYTEERS